MFFDQEWLYTAILLYVAILFVSYVLDRPVIAKVVELMKSGQAGTPEFQALVKKTSGFGAFMGIAFFIIIFLMVWKPGA